MSGGFSNEKKKTLYHYTDPQSAAEIRKAGRIEPSQYGVFGGDMVYLTSMKPTAGRAAIAANNYGRGGETMEQRGSVEAVVKVRLPESHVSKVYTNDGRDVYTHSGPVYLPGKK